MHLRTGLSPDAAHLLIAVAGMDIRLEDDAAGHGLAEEVALGLGRGGGAEDIADGDFAAFEEAGAEDAVGGEAEAVAGLSSFRIEGAW